MSTQVSYTAAEIMAENDFMPGNVVEIISEGPFQGQQKVVASVTQRNNITTITLHGIVGNFVPSSLKRIRTT